MMVRTSALVGMVICTALAITGIVMMNWNVPSPPDQTDPPIYPDTTGMSPLDVVRAVDHWRIAADRYQVEQDGYASELETFALARSLGQWILWPSLLALIWLGAFAGSSRKKDPSP